MTRIQADDALDRWMYRKHGMDFGPFTSREIEALIAKRELWSDTEVYNQRKRQWFRVAEVAKFQDYIDEATRKEAEERRRQEAEADTATVERQARRSHRLPLVLGLGLAVAGGVAAFFLLRPPPPVLAGYPTHFFRDLSFQALEPMSEMRAEPISIQAGRDGAPEPVVRRRTNGSRTRADGTLTAPELDLSYDAEAGSGGRELTQQDIGRIQQGVTGGLVRCFRAEYDRNPEFEGGTVHLYLINKGQVAVSRVSTRPNPSADLIGCVKAATSGVRLAPFSGANRIMEIPIYIQGS
ncbi:MAG TPA: hypothetical protein PK313_01190 [Myxococcota bacterium]|jgi:hypothetical protein|nr:hypothetical protein [Myxococcota bacterium]